VVEKGVHPDQCRHGVDKRQGVGAAAAEDSVSSTARTRMRMMKNSGMERVTGKAGELGSAHMQKEPREEPFS
jgi:hypothetical protein